MRLWTMAGISATRDSPGADSRGTPKVSIPGDIQSGSRGRSKRSVRTVPARSPRPRRSATVEPIAQSDRGGEEEHMSSPMSAGAKITTRNPIVEMDGDEMTRVIWAMVKSLLIEPFVDVKLERYDLGLPERDRTDDAVTVEAARAIQRWGVGVKCATITPNDDRVE